MKKIGMFKIMLVSAALLTVLGGLLAAANQFGAPHTIIHVVTILWKEDSTPEQRQAALDGVKKMGAEIPGIKNVWIKKTKVQGRGASKDSKPGRPYEAAFVIEFADQKAADEYPNHKAHADWEKTYLAIREESTSHQITN